jgi:O-antigen/teichoic acid export membrane protein
MFVDYYLALVDGSSANILVLRDILALIVAPAFLPAYKLVPILLVVTIIQQWTAFCNLGLFLMNSTKLFAVSAVIAVIADLLLNLMLIPPYGMLGAAWATVAAYALRFAIIYVLAQQRYHIDYPWGKTAQLAGVFGMAWAARHFADRLPLPLSLGISAILAVLASIFVYLRLLDRDEQAFIKTMMRRPIFVRTARAA